MHEEMRALLNAYLDGELQGRRLREMETHLESCAECQRGTRGTAPGLGEVTSRHKRGGTIRRALHSATDPEPAAPVATQPPAQVHVPGLVACPGGITDGLGIHPDGFHPDRPGDSCEFYRFAGQRFRVAGKRAGVRVAGRGGDRVRRAAPGTTSPVAAEQRKRFGQQLFYRIRLAGRHRPALLGLAGRLVAAAQPAVEKHD